MAIAALVLAAGCGATARPAAPPLSAPEHDLVAAAEALQADACACPDGTCVPQPRDTSRALIDGDDGVVTLDDAAAARYGRAVLATERCAAHRMAVTREQLMEAFAAVRDSACGCHDATCAHELGVTLADLQKSTTTADEATRDRARGIVSEARACLVTTTPPATTGGAVATTADGARVADADAANAATDLDAASEAVGRDVSQDPVWILLEDLDDVGDTLMVTHGRLPACDVYFRDTVTIVRACLTREHVAVGRRTFDDAVARRATWDVPLLPDAASRNALDADCYQAHDQVLRDATDLAPGCLDQLKK
ncbi:MAG: hypothetical protein KC464_27280 [Myxococcales bacterium]|nr:hypothetical protein [Myxococcales bacterium]